MICVLFVRVCPNFHLSRNAFYCEVKELVLMVRESKSTIRNDFLSTFEMQQKLKEQKEKLDDKESQLFFVKSKNLRLRMRKRSLDEKLAEFARRGSMKAICHNLDKAAQNGYLKDRNTLVGVLQTVARNFHVEKNGRRY